MRYKFVQTGKELTNALDWLSHYPALGLDTETTGLDALTDKILLIQIGNVNYQYVFDVARLSHVEFMSLGAFLASDDITWVGHNLKFDYKMIKTNFGVELKNMRDTFIIEQMLNKGRRQKGYGLADLVERYLPDWQPMSKEERSSFADMSLGDSFTSSQKAYSAYDVQVLLPIVQQQLSNAKALNDPKFLRLLEIECNAVAATADMELNGIRLNKARWQALEDIARKEAAEIKIELDKLVAPLVEKPAQGELDFGEDFIKLINYASPLQVKPVLEKAVGHSLPGTGDEVLKRYTSNKVVSGILKYRKAAKKVSTYGMAFYDKHVRQDTGRVHANFNQARADTGRMSSSDPKLIGAL